MRDNSHEQSCEANLSSDLGTMLPVTKLPESTERKQVVALLWHSLMEEYFQWVSSIAVPEMNMSHRVILYCVPLTLLVRLQVSLAGGSFSSAGGSITIW